MARPSVHCAIGKQSGGKLPFSKRVFSSILAVVLSLGLVPAAAFAWNGASDSQDTAFDAAVLLKDTALVQPQAETDPQVGTPTRQADSSTASTYQNILGEDTDGGRYAGRIWTDKSVYTGSFSENAGDLGTITITNTLADDRTENKNGFLTVFSALGSSRVVNNAVSSPLDVVFIIDVSGSMMNPLGDSSRIGMTVDALNSAISKLMEGEHNRVAVQAFSTASNITTLLPLGHYEAGDDPANPYVREVNKDVHVTALGQPGTVASTRGGTNTQQGILSGMSLLTTSDATPVTIEGVKVPRIPAAIILSDGAPTNISNATGANAGQWWLQSSTSNEGNTSEHFYGEGMVAMMAASYMKQQVTAHYQAANQAAGVASAGGRYDAHVYTVGMGVEDMGANEANLSNVTLNPAANLNDASNSMAVNILDAWRVYQSNGNTGTPAVVYNRNNQTTTLQHPSSGDISTLVYNDGYYAAGDDITTIFDSIVTTLGNQAFNPVQDATGTSSDVALHYSDPLGDYMEVKDVKSVLLFGHEYPVTSNGDGTYSVQSASLSHPVFNTPVDPADIRISVTATPGTSGKPTAYTLNVEAPGSVLPIRLESISEQEDGSLNYSTNKNQNAALPLRVVYTVGVQDAYIDKTTGNVDLSKIDAEYKATHRSSDGAVSFFSNQFSGSVSQEGGRTRGDATVQFTPSLENRYYYFQQERPVYLDNGALSEGVTTRADADAAGTRLSSVGGISDAGSYLVLIDFYRQVPGSGQGEHVEYLVKRTGEEIRNSVRDGSGGVVTIPGSPRLGRLNNFTLAKGDGAGASKTALLAYYPTYLADATDPGTNFGVQVYLGNNGRLNVPETSLFVSKTVEAPEGVTVPSDASFQFTVHVDGKIGTESATPYAVDAAGSWTAGTSSQTVTFDSNGNATITLGNNQGLLIGGLPENAAFTVQEAAPASPYEFEGVGGDGAPGTAAGSFAGTTAFGSTRNVNYVNRYAPTATLDSVPFSKTLTGRTGSPWREGDSFSFHIRPGAQNTASPLPTMKTSDGIEFAVSDISFTVKTVADSTQAASAFSYTATYAGQDASGNGQTVTSAVKQEDGTATSLQDAFGTFTFSDAGTYYYVISENRPTAGNVVAGVTYTPKLYRLIVTVAADPADQTQLKVASVRVQERSNGEGDIVADAWQDAGVLGNQVVFANTYNANEVDRQVAVVKELRGRTLATGQFTFALTAAGGHAVTDAEFAGLGDSLSVDAVKGLSYSTVADQPMPANAVDGVSTASNGEGGRADFASLHITAAAAGADPARGMVYKYTIKEQAPDPVPDGYTYDADTTYDAYIHVYVEDIEDGGVTTPTVRAQVVRARNGVQMDAANTNYAFTNTYEAEGSAVIQGQKRITGRTLAEGDTFTFNLYQGAPTEDSLLQTKTVTVSAADAGKSSIDFSFDAIEYAIAVSDQGAVSSDVGTHGYTLVEVAGNAGGMTYDTAPRTVAVEVTDAGNGTLGTTVDYDQGVAGVQGGPVVWTNSYSAQAVDPAYSLSGVKTMAGRAIADGEFAFRVQPADASWNADGAAYTVNNQAGTDQVDGEFKASIPSLVGPVAYSQAGDYRYVITEVQGTHAGIQYDKRVYRVTVPVTDDGAGNLVVGSVQIQVADNASSPFRAADSVEFANAYEGTPEITLPVVKQVRGGSFNPGDYSFTMSITDADGNDAVESGAARLVEGVYAKPIDATGQVAFGQILFFREGTYTTHVKEQVPEGAVAVDTNGDGQNDAYVHEGMLYDGHETGAVYEVSRNPYGNLEVSRTGVDASRVFVNDAGLRISKEVINADGVDLTDKEFAFRLNLKAAVDGEGTGGDGSAAATALWYHDDKVEVVADGGKITVPANGSTSLFGLPVGTEYTLTELDHEGYVPQQKSVSGTVSSGANGPVKFANDYKPTPSLPEDVATSFVAHKTIRVVSDLLTRPLVAGEFSFTLTPAASNDAASDPLADGATVANNAAGEAVLAKDVVFEKAGTYVYTVTEDRNGDSLAPDIVYDTRAYTITVAVAGQADGRLHASATITSTDGTDAVSAMSFVNEYDPEVVAVSLGGKKVLTGDKELEANEFTFCIAPAGMELAGGESHESVSAEADDAGEVVGGEVRDGEVGDAGGTVASEDSADAEDADGQSVVPAGDGSQAAAGPIESEGVSGEEDPGVEGSDAGSDQLFAMVSDRSVATEGAESVDNADADAPGEIEQIGDEMDGSGEPAGDFSGELMGSGGVNVGAPLESNDGESGDDEDSDVDALVVEDSGSADEADADATADDQPMPRQATTMNRADGSFAFPAIGFTEPGIYRYQITERNDGKPGYTYDDAVFDVTVTVVEGTDGKLVAAVEGVEAVQFINTYAKPTELDKPGTSGDGAGSGDDDGSGDGQGGSGNNGSGGQGGSDGFASDNLGGLGDFAGDGSGSGSGSGSMTKLAKSGDTVPLPAIALLALLAAGATLASRRRYRA